jgi:hypothetical protein
MLIVETPSGAEFWQQSGLHEPTLQSEAGYIDARPLTCRAGSTLADPAVAAVLPMPRRFPPPWSIEEGTESFTVKDATGQAIAYLYFEVEPQRQMSMKRSDEAFLIAVNIAKLTSVPRQILKDIPRPPVSAGRNN